MQVANTYQIKIDQKVDPLLLNKATYIVILHAHRVPPHIGMIIGKEYHSLTIKGHELNVSTEALMRNISQRKIASLFVEIKQHPTFSQDYLKEHFITNIRNYSKVQVGHATCLSPIKDFFEENYSLEKEQVNYLFELLPVLQEKGLINSCSAAFIDEQDFQLPVYSLSELNDGINKANDEAAKLNKNKN